MYKISDAARRAALTVKTVRYYADIGLVTPAADRQPDIGCMPNQTLPSWDLSGGHAATAFRLSNAVIFSAFMKMISGQVPKLSESPLRKLLKLIASLVNCRNCVTNYAI